ncbi:hypothetical protein E2C01_012335 [Portunus trituberculatus]|uniref:Uncharacterized protein n=1 Tax=Portunus trituberculatus TaxID=210409 RepID=A0A5B7DDG0_PORTR|nr:hypothetical protein [Portunus trituberculatus]
MSILSTSSAMGCFLLMWAIRWSLREYAALHIGHSNCRSRVSEVLHAEVSDQRVFAGGGKPTQAATELLGAQVDAKMPGEGVWVRGDEWALLALVDIIVVVTTTAATSAGGGAVCDGGNQGERR